MCDRVARQIDRELATLLELGGDGLSIAADLRQAALTEADGRVVEALGILRQAHARLGRLTDQLFEARIREVEDRVAGLEAGGIRLAVAADLAQLRSEAAQVDRAPALRRLRGLGDRLIRVEGDWKGLRDLLAQIEQLQEAATAFGLELPMVADDIGRARALVADEDVTSERMDEASQVAARALMMLHEALAPPVEQELNRHAVTLQKWPDNHAPARPVKLAHADAMRALRRGRLADATQRLRELREMIESLETATPPVPVAARAPAGPPAPDDGALEGLLAKARGLAARVRGLPPESEVAFEAASEIRRATELLRARKLEEADQTLSRLMQTLSTEPTPGG